MELRKRMKALVAHPWQLGNATTTKSQPKPPAIIPPKKKKKRPDSPDSL